VRNAASAAADPAKVADESRILALFDAAGPVETPTPSVRAWLARDPDGNGRPVLIKRIGGGKAGGEPGARDGALALVHPQIVRPRRWLLGPTGELYVVRDVVGAKTCVKF
jgi:hypothetical protein